MVYGENRRPGNGRIGGNRRKKGSGIPCQYGQYSQSGQSKTKGTDDASVPTHSVQLSLHSLLLHPDAPGLIESPVAAGVLAALGPAGHHGLRLVPSVDAADGIEHLDVLPAGAAGGLEALLGERPRKKADKKPAMEESPEPVAEATCSTKKASSHRARLAHCAISPGFARPMPLSLSAPAVKRSIPRWPHLTGAIFEPSRSSSLPIHSKSSVVYWSSGSLWPAASLISSKRGRLSMNMHSSADRGAMST